MEIRAYHPSDRDACLALFDSNMPKFFMPSERADFAAFIDDLPCPYFVLCDGKEVVGCGGYAINPGTGGADICWDVIHRDRHGQGLGRRLLAFRLEKIKAEPEAKFVRLDTSQHTTGFYARLGFEVQEIEPGGYGPGLDRCEMRLALNPP
jgi:ribosomal protein S18 acetylase RimI-like enzyme